MPRNSVSCKGPDRPLSHQEASPDATCGSPSPRKGASHPEDLSQCSLQQSHKPKEIHSAWCSGRGVRGQLRKSPQSTDGETRARKPRRMSLNLTWLITASTDTEVRFLTPSSPRRKHSYVSSWAQNFLS